MALRDHITEKALVCIDEALAPLDKANASFYPVAQLLDDAARWVVRAVPLHALGSGKPLPAEGLIARGDGTGELPLPGDFIRMLRFRMVGWMRPAIGTIRDTDAAYVQQFNRVLRGSENRPVVVVCENDKRLEYFSSSRGVNARIAEARYFGFTEVDDDYPEGLADITSWKTAEMVLAVMNDTGAMQLCAGKVNEILQVL